MAEGIWIHHDCKPEPGREEIAARRDHRLKKDPKDPYGGMRWAVRAEGWLADKVCGICDKKFKPGDPITGFRLDRD